MADENDDLLAEALKELRRLEQQAEETGAELGDEIELGVKEHFRGRVRGRTTVAVKDKRTGETRPTVAFLFWDRHGAERFLWESADLVEKMDAAQWEMGDEIIIVRGNDRKFTFKGEPRRKKLYSVKVRPCPDPLPGTVPLPPSEPPPGPPASDQLGDSDELPFLCRGEHDLQSASSAAAGTG
jgi:hypothetical protein